MPTPRETALEDRDRPHDGRRRSPILPTRAACTFSLPQLLCAAFALLTCSLLACHAPDAEPAVDGTAERLFAGDVDAACGPCRFGMPPPGCDLAVYISGRAYFVDGSRIDEHGDAHADDGFCNAIRRAYVSGRIVGDRFEASEFMLLP